MTLSAAVERSGRLRKLLRKYSSHVLIILVICGVATPWLCALLLLAFKFGWPRTLEGAAQLGDSFGVVNALFSSLAFAKIILTIWRQEELAHGDRKITSEQMSEAAFFEMNRIAREANASIRLMHPDGNIYVGVDAANKLRDEFARGVDEEYPSWRARKSLFNAGSYQQLSV